MPLSVRLSDFRSRKLRNQDGRLPETTPNATFLLGIELAVYRRKHGEMAVHHAKRDQEVTDHSSNTDRPIARNVVLAAREFDHYLMRPEVKGYRQVAVQFNVTKATVSNYLSILRRLPPEFVDWLEKCMDIDVLAYFSERRLRPATRLSRPEQVRKLINMANQFDGTSNALRSLKELLRDIE